jgi:hypothetical protein
VMAKTEKTFGEEGILVSMRTGSGNCLCEMHWIKTFDDKKAVLVGHFSRFRTLLWFGWKAFRTGKFDTFPGFVIRKTDISSWNFGKRINYELELEIREQYRKKFHEWVKRGCEE